MENPQSVQVVIEDLSNHPKCVHGPMLLFKRNGCESFFACSACRSQKECLSSVEPTLFYDTNYDKNNNVNYCHQCQIRFSDENDGKIHSNHKIVRNVDVRNPTKFLKPIQNDKKEAQYFFEQSTLNLFGSIFKQNNLKKVVCIGTPRLHEYLKIRYKNIKIQSLLLDIDHRFGQFYNRNEYLFYNMFNHHFFGGKPDIVNFNNFIRIDDSENICLVIDPPFGCRTEILADTIKTISKQYQYLNNTKRILPIIWIFPYFMENYIISVMPELNMLDYQVNYTNHSNYNKMNDKKSPIRMFTNIYESNIILPAEEGYRFCDTCNRYTSETNIHCEQCNICPSKNGTTYTHCVKCAICVKSNYQHCNKCERCTQVDGHNCNLYVKQLHCMICRKRGHNEIACGLLSSSNLIEKLFAIKRKSMKIGRKICYLCNLIGHNEKMCKKRNSILVEMRFMSQFSDVRLK